MLPTALMFPSPVTEQFLPYEDLRDDLQHPEDKYPARGYFKSHPW